MLLARGCHQIQQVNRCLLFGTVVRNIYVDIYFNKAIVVNNEYILLSRQLSI